MPKSPKRLLIGSTEVYSGKSSVTLGIAHHLQKRGIDIAYGKPLGTCFAPDQDGKPPLSDEDVEFVGQILNLSASRLYQPLLCLSSETICRRLRGEDQTDYQQALTQSLQKQNGDLLLLEGPGTLDEGSVFGLSLPKMAQIIDAAVLLVARFQSLLLVDACLVARQRLGDRLIGILINDVPPEALDTVNQVVEPFLATQAIPVLGVLPRDTLLRSVSVGELVHQLKAEVLCCRDRLDLMVEMLKIGAMNVNAALEYLRKGRNMAVVTGGDRTDIQLAALETSTQCLILTGHPNPNPMILSRAEDLEIPILSVDSDTLTTVEIIDRTFGQTRLHGSAKVGCIRQLIAQHFDLDSLIAQLDLETAVTSQSA